MDCVAYRMALDLADVNCLIYYYSGPGKQGFELLSKAHRPHNPIHIPPSGQAIYYVPSRSLEPVLLLIAFTAITVDIVLNT